MPKPAKKDPPAPEHKVKERKDIPPEHPQFFRAHTGAIKPLKVKR